MADIKLFTVTWSTDTAGVSPDNNMRTELFFKGCKKAITGNACLGCFNSPLWKDNAKFTYTAEEIANQIKEHAPNKYVTIGGGEPTDQLEGLVELTRLLKEDGFHIMVYTWKDLHAVLHNHTGERAGFLELIDNIDLLVDGIYNPAQRLYQMDQADGFLSSIGSGNQTIWDIRNYRLNNELIGYKMGDVMGLYLKENDDLVYVTRGEKEPLEFITAQKGAA